MDGFTSGYRVATALRIVYLQNTKMGSQLDLKRLLLSKKRDTIFENHFCRCPVFFYLFLTNLIEIGTLTLAQISHFIQLGKRKTFSINTLFSRGGCDKLVELKGIFMGCVLV